MGFYGYMIIIHKTQTAANHYSQDTNMGIRRSTQKVRSRGDLEGARRQIINHYTIGQASYNGESGTGWNAQGRRLMEQGSCTYEGLMMEGYEHLAQNSKMYGLHGILCVLIERRNIIEFRFFSFSRNLVPT